MGTKANIFRRGFGGRVGMERPNGTVDEKHLSIGSFTNIINIGLVILFGCAFNEVHGVTRDGANYDFGDYFWDPGSILVSMSYRFPDLKTVNRINRSWFVLIICLSWKIESSWGEINRVHVNIVCDIYIRGGFHGTRTT